MLRRSFELKIELLTQVFGWQLLVIDEREFLGLQETGLKEAYIRERLQPLAALASSKGQTKKGAAERKGGRRVKRV